MANERQLIHSDFETIKEYSQNYRISTSVEYSTDGVYHCTALLYKSSSGKVRGDPMYRKYFSTMDQDEVEKILQKQTDDCMEKISNIEDAKSLDINVSVE